eukprot:809154-Amphidinium_carterae.2
MGTGKVDCNPETAEKSKVSWLPSLVGSEEVALQLFLAEHKNVYGVELAPSRWQLAVLALQKLADFAPERFTYEGQALPLTVIVRKLLDQRGNQLHEWGECLTCHYVSKSPESHDPQRAKDVGQQ